MVGDIHLPLLRGGEERGEGEEEEEEAGSGCCCCWEGETCPGDAEGGADSSWEKRRGGITEQL